MALNTLEVLVVLVETRMNLLLRRKTVERELGLLAAKRWIELSKLLLRS